MANPPIPQAQSPTKVVGKCLQCQTPISAPFPPIVTFNSPTVSTLAIPHPKGATCPKCGVWYGVIINPTACSIGLALVPMDKPFLNEDNLVEEVSSPFSFPPLKLT